ncbi:MAG: MBL fold metallo-hydrolase [Candidatus Hodarchaeales archaeon]|jgi:glyoxylase-like metal-dependent hydrolase (beta-lactamase superfamily II)
MIFLFLYQRLKICRHPTGENEKIFLRIQLPVPFAVGTVNVYLFYQLEPFQVCLIDCGVNLPINIQMIENIIKDKVLSKIDKIFCTHLHSDHAGSSGYFQRNHGSEVYTTVDGVKIANRILPSIPNHWEKQLLIAGVPETLIRELIKLYMKFKDLNNPAEQFSIFEDNDQFRGYTTPGHSPESLCFHFKNDGIIVTGDTVLPDITPNTGFGFPNPNGSNKLANFRESLNFLSTLPVKEYFPGHGSPKDNFRERIEQQLHSTTSREAIIARYFDRGIKLKAFQVARKLFPNIPNTEIPLAAGECYYFLDLLAKKDQIRNKAGNKGQVVFYK